MLTVYGDSIAHGGRDGGWPIRLRQRLWECGLGDGLYVQAIPGNTSFDLVRRMPVELPLRPTQSVLIAIGTNDAQRLMDDEHPRVTDEEFRNNLNACITLAKQHARWVIILSPYGLAAQRDESGIRHITAQRLAAISRINKEVADDRACWYIDLADTLKDQHFAPDGVHPLPSGHDLIAERVWQGLRRTGCFGSPEDLPDW